MFKPTDTMMVDGVVWYHYTDDEWFAVEEHGLSCLIEDHNGDEHTFVQVTELDRAAYDFVVATFPDFDASRIYVWDDKE